MSLSEVMDLNVAHPWANVRLNNIVADGTMNIAGGVIYGGNVTVQGTLTANGAANFNGITSVNNELRTSVIRPLIPNADITVPANGSQFFDIQTAGVRANVGEIDIIDSKTVGPLILGGPNSTSIEVSNDVLPDADNSLDLGSAAARYAEAHAVSYLGDSLASTVGSGLDLSLSGDSGVVHLPSPQILEADSIRSNAAQPLTLTSNGATNITLTSGSGVIDIGASDLDGTNLLFGNSSNVINGKVDDTADLGTALLGFRNGYINNLVINQKAAYNQATNINTAVTITNNESAFQILTQNATTASTAFDDFVINQANLSANSYIFCQVVAYSGTPFTNGVPMVYINSVGAGVATVRISNYGANALNGVFFLRFLIV